jgi:hypothetical protein
MTFQTKPKQKCVMTQKSPMTQEKKTFTTPFYPKLKIKKIKLPTSKRKNKSWVSRVHVAFPHWFSMICIF